MSAPAFRLLFFGSDAFSLRVLNQLVDRRLCVINVITKQNGPVEDFARDKRLIHYRWPLDNFERIRLDSNIGLVASFGDLIDIDTIKLFKYGLFNIHPSLLPRYRGSSPVQAAILDGCTETGCTLMRIPPVAKFDIGDIILQERLPIKKGEYALQLRDRLADLGVQLAERLLINYDDCLANARPQATEGRSYAKKIKPEQGLLEFKSLSVDSIDRKVRAYTGFVDSFTKVWYRGEETKLSLHRMRSPDEIATYDVENWIGYVMREKGLLGQEKPGTDIVPGTIFFHKKYHTLFVKCADGCWLAFDEVRLESRPLLNAAEFYNGFMPKNNPIGMSTLV